MSYPGSKGGNGIWHRIIGQMPPHDIYVEAFFGSGQVWRQKRPAAISYLIDADAGILPRSDAVTRSLTGSFLELLQELPLTAESLVYADPPYLFTTRAGRRYYRHEFGTVELHTSLLALLQGLPCRVLISHPPCEFYGRALQNWRCIRYRAMTRGGKKPDALWANFTEPAVLHDWRFAGSNFRQRTSLKRLAGRWLRKLDRMNDRQRGYLLHAIAQRHFERGGPQSQSAPDLTLGAVAGPPAPDLTLAAASVRNGV